MVNGKMKIMNFNRLDIFLQSLILRKMKKEMKEDQKDSF